MSQSVINGGLNVKRSLLDAVLAGLIALIVFGPIVGIVLNGYSFNFEPHRLVWIIVAVMAGRLLLSLFLQTAPGRKVLARFEPVIFDAALVDRVERHAGALKLTTRRMPSGAGHDAQMMQRICPTAMIFVPSVNGLSHNIAEYTAPEDLERGANVLLHVILARAGQNVS